MSLGEDSGAPARTAPPRPDDGFPLLHAGYRSYVLFAATAIILALDALIVLRAARVLLGGRPELWDQHLDAFRSPLGVVISAVLLLCTLFFSVRWLRVDPEVPTLRHALSPASPGGLLLAAQFGGLALVSALVLLVLGGILL